jgi:hypothetical protein
VTTDLDSMKQFKGKLISFINIEKQDQFQSFIEPKSSFYSYKTKICEVTNFKDDKVSLKQQAYAIDCIVNYVMYLIGNTLDKIVCSD